MNAPTNISILERLVNIASVDGSLGIRQTGGMYELVAYSTGMVTILSRTPKVAADDVPDAYENCLIQACAEARKAKILLTIAPLTSAQQRVEEVKARREAFKVVS